MLKKIFSSLVLEYFRFFATLQLRKNKDATIIGVTGSTGKTSTRLAIIHILRGRGQVKHSVHANSESGIPLNILGLSPRSYTFFDWLRLIILAPIKLMTNWEHYNYYVVEMGIDSPDSPKNMSYLLKIIRPHIGVVLNAGLTHSAGFDHLIKDTSPIRRMDKLVKVIAKEKMQLAKGVQPGGVAVFNIDQKELLAQKKDVTARQITFGRSDKANLRILDSAATRAGFMLKFSYQGQIYRLGLVDVFPQAYAYTFAAAIATAAGVGIPPTISLPGLASYTAPPGRMRIFGGLSGSTIIDSSYNASPDSVLESLKLLRSLAGRNKKIAVIGDMRELGTSEKISHKNLADWLLEYADIAVLYGDLTGAHTLPVLLSQKFPVRHFKEMSGLTKYLHTIIKDKSYVLVKGSQNTIFLERAVESILANPKDVTKLCRRGAYWDKLRARTP